jgi:hypothetical protein
MFVLTIKYGGGVMDKSMSELIWKMECKGYDMDDIHFFVEIVWLIVHPIFMPPPTVFFTYLEEPVSEKGYYWELYQYQLNQAHVEIDFMGFKR